MNELNKNVSYKHLKRQSCNIKICFITIPCFIIPQMNDKISISSINQTIENDIVPNDSGRRKLLHAIIIKNTCHK